MSSFLLYLVLVVCITTNTNAAYFTPSTFYFDDFESDGSSSTCSRVVAIHPECDLRELVHRTNEQMCGFCEDKIICDLLNYETGQFERHIYNSFNNINKFINQI